jgi:hypothetical protein
VHDRGSRVPLREQLEAILRKPMADGDLTGRVPSILTLAQEYGGVSPDDPARAYDAQG